MLNNDMIRLTEHTLLDVVHQTRHGHILAVRRAVSGGCRAFDAPNCTLRGCQIVTWYTYQQDVLGIGGVAESE